MEIKGFKAFLPGLKTLEGNPKLQTTVHCQKIKMNMKKQNQLS